MKGVSNSSASNVLENFYELDGTMPQELAERVSPTHPENVYSNISSPNRTQREEQAIINMFKDPRLTLEQREQLSASILHGKFELVEEALLSRSKPKWKESDQEKKRIADLTLARHRLPKPSFLQVITQSAPIPVMSGREARTQKLNIQHRMGTPSPAPEVPLPPSRKGILRSRGISDMNDSTFGPEMFPKSSLKELQNHLVAEHNRNRLERSKQDTKLRTEHANQLKRLETATNEKKMEVKKKLHDVRKSLRAHLVNTRDPQVGTIMRLVDESLIYHFMEKYSGFSMTAQAILSLIGSSMNTNLMNPIICDEDKPMNLLQVESDGDSSVRNEIADTKDVPILNFDDSRVNTPVASASRTAAANSSIRRKGATTAPTGGTTGAFANSSSRGRSRGLLDSTSAVASIPRTARQRGRITNSSDFQPTDKRMHSSRNRDGTEKTHYTAVTDAVTGFSPRKYHADRPQSPENKAWGGGFRVTLPRSDSPPPPMKPIVPMTVTRPASLPGKSRNFSPSQTRKPPRSAGNVGRGESDGGGQSLVLFGSENVRLTARSMGFTIEGLSLSDDMASDRVDDGDHHSLSSHHTHHTLDSYHTSVPSNAIAAMHEQLIEENILPSMQPEPVLSQSQLEELGLHKKTFNEILKEISKASLTKSQQTFSTDPALAIEAPGLSQYNSAPQSRINSARESMNDSYCGSPREDYEQGDGDGLQSESASPVKELVNSMMKASNTRKSLFVTPLSETALVPPAPKNYATLYGSVYTAEDKERFHHLSALEVERAEQRYGIDRQPPSPHHISLSRPYEGSPGKLPQLAPLTQPPRAIKTKSGKRDELDNPMPESPYMSYEEECRVQNTGVPAGAGMMLWRPRYRVSNDGRYRAGQSRTRIRSSLQKGPTKRPFVSSA